MRNAQRAAGTEDVRVDVVEVGRRLSPSGGTRDQVVDRKRGVNDPGAAWPMRPRPVSVGVVHAPRCRCPVRRPDEADGPTILPEPAGTRSVSRHVIRVDDLTAITSGSMRTRRVAVQGSPLRSNRVLRTRLARVRVGSWTTVVSSERETLTAPRRARSVGIYVMAGRVAIGERSRDLQLQAISKVQRS